MVMVHPVKHLINVSLRVVEGRDGAVVLLVAGDHPLADAAVAAQRAAAAPRSCVVLGEDIKLIMVC